MPDIKKKTINIAAIQMRAILGDFDTNLAKAENLARTAFEKGASWVILPEFFTSAVGFNPKMIDAICPFNGKPKQLLIKLAREYNGVVGGSFIAFRDDNAYNTFILAFPDGTIFTHDKDQPTMWENCYYIGGNDVGIFDTSAGRVGVALCWEMIRTRTVKRLRGKVDFVLGGSCWWSLPVDGPPGLDALREYNKALFKETPSTLSKLLGVPVIHASHAGEFEGYHSPDESNLRKYRFLGETQIVDGIGTILERMSFDDGDGIINAEIVPGQAKNNLNPIPERFWIPDLLKPFLNTWETQNQHGKEYYENITLPYLRKKFSEI